VWRVSWGALDSPPALFTKAVGCGGLHTSPTLPEGPGPPHPSGVAGTRRSAPCFIAADPVSQGAPAVDGTSSSIRWHLLPAVRRCVGDWLHDQIEAALRLPLDS